MRLHTATNYQSVEHAKHGWTKRRRAAASHQEPTAEELKRMRRPSAVPIEGVTSTGCELPGWMRQLCVVGGADRDEMVEPARIAEKSPVE